VASIELEYGFTELEDRNNRLQAHSKLDFHYYLLCGKALFSGFHQYTAKAVRAWNDKPSYVAWISGTNEIEF
jgi:hypothetical protein